MTQSNDIAGTAALAICESLLLALSDHKVLPHHEILGVLHDAAAAFEQGPAGDEGERNAAVAALIRSVYGNGRRVSQRR